MIRRCPICGRPSDSSTQADFPFCSERCRLIDLGQWAAEKYRVIESAGPEPDTPKPSPLHDKSIADS